METPSAPRILMCPPDYFGIEYEINPWMNVRVGSDSERRPAAVDGAPSDPRGAGRRRGSDRAGTGLPDLVFTANAGLVYRKLFIGSRFRYGVRQGDRRHFEEWARAQGSRSSTCRRAGTSRGPATRLFCGETLFAGYRFRSDVRSHQWIGEQLGVEVLPLELVDPRFYHLDTCFCPLAPDLALYYPGAFDEYGRSVLRDRIPHLIEVVAEEADLVQLQRRGRRQDGHLERRGAQAGRTPCRAGLRGAIRSASPSSSSRAAAPSA